MNDEQCVTSVIVTKNVGKRIQHREGISITDRLHSCALCLARLVGWQSQRPGVDEQEL